MNYHELLKKYKEGVLDSEEKAQVERDIEKHEAISDYLYENGEIPELQEVFNGTKQEQGDKEEDDFVTLINQHIRKAFTRLGLSVLAVSLAMVLFIQFCLPGIVSAFFYNPARKNAEYDNQMSMDMAVYTELFIPCMRRHAVDVNKKGYGKYDFTVRQNASHNGRFTSVSGEITRGKLKYYNDDLLKPPTSNCFVWTQVIGDLSRPLTEVMEDQYNMCAAGYRDDSLGLLQNLDDKEFYIGYVSLNRMMDYETFMEYLENKPVNEPWCAVKTRDAEGEDVLDESGEDIKYVTFRADNIGFCCDVTTHSSFEWDREKYPELFWWGESTEQDDDMAIIDQLEERMRSEGYMQKHFTSLLNYMADQKQFFKMMNSNQPVDELSLRNAAEYVKENGITVYGFAGIMTKDTILELSKDEEVYEIYTVVLQ